MKKKDRIYKVLAVAGFGLGVYALIRYELLLISFNQAVEGLRQVSVDLRFADITDRFDQTGDK